MAHDPSQHDLAANPGTPAIPTEALVRKPVVTIRSYANTRIVVEDGLGQTITVKLNPMGQAHERDLHVRIENRARTDELGGRG